MLLNTQRVTKKLAGSQFNFSLRRADQSFWVASHRIFDVVPTQFVQQPLSVAVITWRHSIAVTAQIVRFMRSPDRLRDCRRLLATSACHSSSSSSWQPAAALHRSVYCISKPVIGSSPRFDGRKDRPSSVSAAITTTVNPFNALIGVCTTRTSSLRGA